MQEFKNMRNVIHSGVSSIYGTTHVLARLWRTLIFESQVTADQWDRLITDWTAKQANKGSDKDHTSRKGNITKQLAKRTISWNAWMIGLSILKYEKIEINIKVFKKSKVRELNLSVDIENEVSTNDNEL